MADRRPLAFDEKRISEQVISEHVWSCQHLVLSRFDLKI